MLPATMSLTRQEINRLILEYLIIEGYKGAAEKFSAEIGLKEPLCELEPAGSSLLERMWIREAIVKRQIDETIERINQLWPELFEHCPVIYFQLRQLQMLELIRQGKLEEALNFAQLYLAEPVSRQLGEHPQLLNEIENTMALLAFEHPGDSIYGNLLSNKHAEIVAGSLNRSILRYLDSDRACNGISATVPRLTKMMAILLHFKDQPQTADLLLPLELTSF
ncbi:Glucose-induced degradation complex subunit [Cichlidogyrus casuarinus]|uniref:Glucose-induced degradation complex subunit n=1 Tax=Cichlidogyrus casuarinus TaxID=1844966 RepID=A0ABD2PXW0_9PLAT